MRDSKKPGPRELQKGARNGLIWRNRLNRRREGPQLSVGARGIGFVLQDFQQPFYAAALLRGQTTDVHVVRSGGLKNQANQFAAAW